MPVSGFDPKQKKTKEKKTAVNISAHSITKNNNNNNQKSKNETLPHSEIILINEKKTQPHKNKPIRHCINLKWMCGVDARPISFNCACNVRRYATGYKLFSLCTCTVFERDRSSRDVFTERILQLDKLENV